MGTITTGIGLVSGLNIQELVGKLIDLESGASKRLQNQIDKNTEIQTLLSTLSLRIVGFNLSATRLGKGQAFTERTASASSTALTVSAGKGATLGTFQFTPRRLVSTNQLLSSGFASPASSITSTSTTIKISQGGFVDESTKLSNLNGGAGVRSGSIRIVDGSGASAIVDLTGAVTVQDVVDSINAAANINVQASVLGDQLRILDASGGAGTLQVQNVAGGFTASDLGLTTLSQSGNVFLGADVFSLGPALSLESLRDGNGVRSRVGNDFTITAGTVSFNVDVSEAKTVGDVLDLINNNAGNTNTKIQASINGDRIQLFDSLANDDITVSAIGGSNAASDLGILGTGSGGILTGADVIGALNTVLLSTLRGGGAQLAPVAGSIDINGTTIDLSAATTLQDVINGVNAAGISGVTASINPAANGLVIRRSGGPLTVSDISGNLAAFLNIAGSSSGPDGVLDSGDLDRQYVNENTRLADYGAAAGVPKGKFRITDGNGASAIVDLTQETDDTIGDVIREINTRGLAVSARINDSGDGILIQNTAGTGAVSVQEVGSGTTARALRLLAPPITGGHIDGKLEVSVQVQAGTSLNALVTKLTESGAPVRAAVVNDGSSLAPFRLSLTSSRSGSAGRLLIDPGDANLPFVTVSKAQDAVLLYGSTEPGSSPIQLVSQSNTFNNLVPGLQINAASVSTTPVAVTVSENSQSVSAAAQAFVDAYNAIRAFIKENSSYDPETDTRGKLFTDPTTRQIERQLSSFISRAFQNTGGDIRTLGAVGISLNSNGQLDYDPAALDRALAANRDGVEKLFSAPDTGVVAQLQELTSALTAAGDGVITDRVDLIGKTVDRQRASLDSQAARLKAREELLYKQFYAMETALSAFQSQQTALAQLASIATSIAK